MSRSKEVMDRVKELGIVAVVRGKSEEEVHKIVESLVAGGITGIEITFTVPNALKVIESVHVRFGDRILLGAGTVLTPAEAAAAIANHARYIVSPCVNLQIISLCNAEDITVMPGAMTPTEVVTAWRSGADCVKLFPAEILGVAYLKALKAPLPDVPLMPTGGVNVDNVAEWLDAGACALGVGSALVDKKAVAEKNFSKLTETAQRFVKALADYRARKAK